MEANTSTQEGQEDRVIHEFDVHLASSLAGKLHLLQHPVRTRRFGIGLEPVGAQFKPNAGCLQLALPISTEKRAYDEDRGRDMAKALVEDAEIQRKLRQRQNQNQSAGRADRVKIKAEDTETTTATDAATTAEDIALGSAATLQVMDRVMIGSSPMPLMTSYMVGVLRKDGLHLTPLTAAHQLRPTLQHVDVLDAKNKRLSKADGDEDVEMAENNSAAATAAASASSAAAKAKLASARAVQVKVKSAQAMEQERQERSASQTYLRQRVEEESWITFKYSDVESNLAYETFTDLFSKADPDQSPLQCTTTSADYLEQLLNDATSSGATTTVRLQNRP